MYINPFIITRSNRINKDQFNILFKRLSIEELLLITDKIKIIKEEAIFIVEQLVESENVNALLDLKRGIKKENYEKIIKAYKKYKVSNESIDVVENLINLISEKNRVMEEIKENHYELMLRSRNNIKTMFTDNEYLKIHLLFTNPSINKNLQQYLSTNIKDFKKNHRQTENTLYNFIVRSIFKTSPFGLLTSVSRKGYMEDERVGEISLNQTFLLKYFHKALEFSENFLENIKFSIPPASFTIEDNKHFINAIVLESDPSQNKMIVSSEKVKKIRVPSSIYYYLEGKELNDFFDYKSISSLLGRGVSEDNKKKLFRKLMSLGLFIPAIHFNENSHKEFVTDILEKSKYLLDDEVGKEFRSNIVLLEELCQNSFHNWDYSHSVNTFNKINLILSRLNLSYNINYKANEIFYYDSYISDDIKSKDDTEIDNKSLQNLQKLQVFNLIFDASLRLRLELKSEMNKSFDQRYLKFDNQFFDTLFKVSKKLIPYWGDFKYVDTDPSSTETKMLDHLKVDFIKDFSEYVKGDENEIDIEILIDSFIKDIPKTIIDLNKNSTFFVQENSGRLILNACYEGNEKYSARFMNFFTNYLKNDEKYNEFLESHYNNNNYYELNESLGFNGNVKSNLLKKQCYTVGVGNQRFNFNEINNNKHFIKVEDLKFVNNNNYTEVLSNSIGDKVSICLRGSLTPALMPGYVSTLLQAFSIGGMYYRFPELLDEEIIPRITLGDIIISRKRIRLSMISADIQEILSLKDGAEKFIEINKLFIQHNIPQQLFILIDKGKTFEENSYSRVKPLFFDVETPLSAEQFLKRVKQFIKHGQESGIFIEEYLSNNENFAKEIQFEMYT